MNCIPNTSEEVDRKKQAGFISHCVVQKQIWANISRKIRTCSRELSLIGIVGVLGSALLFPDDIHVFIPLAIAIENENQDGFHQEIYDDVSIQEQSMSAVFVAAVSSESSLPQVIAQYEQKQKIQQQQAQVQDEQDVFIQQMREMLADHPMEVMSDELAEQEKIVAAMLIGIAKKESNWGKRSPSKNGVDCYNYWGYTSTGSRGKVLGYSCFGSVEEAVSVVGKRVHTLAIDQGRDTPAKMVTPWKCGRSCATHSPQSVSKWIADVNLYFSRITQ